jgi:hypothetical protein
MFGAFVSRIKRKSLIIFLFHTWYCFWIHLYVTICMKLDPGMHIVMHLVFFGKTGVTLTLIVVFSSIFDLLPLRSTWMCYLCLQGSLPCLWSSTKATHQVWFMLEVKRCLKLFLQGLYATPVWPVRHTGLTGVSCEVKCLTGLAGHHHRSDRWSTVSSSDREERV